MKKILISLLASLALPSAINAGMRFERIPTGYCSTSQKKAPKGSDCFSFTETNDGDPSVYVLGKLQYLIQMMPQELAQKQEEEVALFY